MTRRLDHRIRGARAAPGRPDQGGAWRRGIVGCGAAVAPLSGQRRRVRMACAAQSCILTRAGGRAAAVWRGLRPPRVGGWTVHAVDLVAVYPNLVSQLTARRAVAAKVFAGVATHSRCVGQVADVFAWVPR